MKVIKGFITALEVSTGKHKYSHLPTASKVWSLLFYPFDPQGGVDMEVYLCGEYGVTASLASWVNAVLRELVERIRYSSASVLDLIRWECPENETQNYIVYEARFTWEKAGESNWVQSYLAAGFTDFSGEGGRGDNEMHQFCLWLKEWAANSYGTARATNERLLAERIRNALDPVQERG